MNCLFNFALKKAREANLDARAILEEDTLLFFQRIVAKLHGVNLNKEFNPKKKQKNTVKAITSGETTQPEGSGKSKGKPPALPKGNKGNGKGEWNDRSTTPPPSTSGKGDESKKGNAKVNQPLLKERQRNQWLSRTHLQVRRRPPLQPYQLHPKLRRQ